MTSATQQGNVINRKKRKKEKQVGKFTLVRNSSQNCAWFFKTEAKARVTYVTVASLRVYSLNKAGLRSSVTLKEDSGRGTVCTWALIPEKHTPSFMCWFIGDGFREAPGGSFCWWRCWQSPGPPHHHCSHPACGRGLGRK